MSILIQGSLDCGDTQLEVRSGEVEWVACDPTAIYQRIIVSRNVDIASLLRRFVCCDRSLPFSPPPPFNPFVLKAVYESALLV